MHVMGNRLATIALFLFVVSCNVPWNGCAKYKKQPPPPVSDTAISDFDYFLLTLSWTPEFCASDSTARSSAECDPNKHVGLVVHGLRPQYDNGKSPQNCASMSPVASTTVDHMMPIMPGKELIQHEWANHGTCSGLSTHDYFGVIEKLYNGLEVPPNFKTPSSSFAAVPTDIEQKFAKANNAPKGAFRISCPQNEFLALEICLSKDFQYQACPATLRDCRATKIEVRRVP